MHLPVFEYTQRCYNMSNYSTSATVCFPQRSWYLSFMATATKKPKKRSANIAIVRRDDCTGCEACIVFCPVDCIDLMGAPENPAEKYVLIDKETCIGCTLCARYCPWESIDMVVREPFEQRAELVFM